MIKIQYEAYWLLKSEVYDFFPNIPAKWDTINIPRIDDKDLVATYNWKYEDWVFIFEINK